MKSKKGYKIENDMIVINRDLNELDKFLRDFLDVLKKHSDYLVVSGFVSISTGRTRGTEDIDLLVPIMDERGFEKLFKGIIDSGFWRYQGDSSKGVYDYIKHKDNIRFARKGQMFPNIEFVPIDETRKVKFFEFNHPQKMKIRDFEFKIPPIEFEILYKEIVLAGEKDIADARHLRTFFKEIIKEERLKEYEEIIKEEVM